MPTLAGNQSCIDNISSLIYVMFLVFYLNYKCSHFMKYYSGLNYTICLLYLINNNDIRLNLI